MEGLFEGCRLALLTWGAWWSRESGYRGRLLLDASPGSMVFYKRIGFQSLDVEAVLHEGIRYSPMELPPEAADELLRIWEE